MVLPQRKRNRLEGYDYSQDGAYFLTICLKNRQPLLWDMSSVGAANGRPPGLQPCLSEWGQIVEQGIQGISARYPMVSVDKYVVMPDHIHMILVIDATQNGRPLGAPTVPTIINQFEGWVARQIKASIWQKSYHDQILRSYEKYLEKWTYIDGNPLVWEQDNPFIHT